MNSSPITCAVKICGVFWAEGAGAIHNVEEFAISRGDDGDYRPDVIYILRKEIWRLWDRVRMKEKIKRSLKMETLPCSMDIGVGCQLAQSPHSMTDV